MNNKIDIYPITPRLTPEFEYNLMQYTRKYLKLHGIDFNINHADKIIESCRGHEAINYLNETFKDEIDFKKLDKWIIELFDIKVKPWRNND